MDSLEGTTAPNDKLDSTIDSIGEIIGSLASQFLDHPGFMWAASGFEVLHADWPAYPIGHGLANALATLAEFPSGTRFSPIDSIDQCTLFVTGISQGEEFDRKRYHIALWNDDIVELAERGFINDVWVADREFEFVFLEYRDDHIALSSKGEHAILVYELAFDVHPQIMDRIRDFLLSEHYDTAVREATILIEMKMREATGSSRYGQALIEECFGEHGKLLHSGIPNSTRLEIRSAFRRLFRYVRNDFAHSLKSLTLVTATRLLRRCSRLLVLLETLKKARSGF
jgi:uncharacterized protein (TIGR02391 family)